MLHACAINAFSTGVVVLQSSTELVDLFGLGPEEELLERFACALLQTYHCSHNDFTPEQQVPQVQR